jgi:opacity protein-like surface antigen
MKKLLAAVLLALTFCTAAQANPTYSFVCITNNNAGNAAIGEAQLFVDVSAITNQVLFTFRNIGPQPCFIRGVYFDDGTLLALADLIDKDQNGGDPNVDFSQGASPPDLPGRNNISPPFNTTAGFLAAADSPGTNKDGVDPYESLGVIFNLKTGKT